MKRAYDAGHEIAMHTWSHNYMTTLTNEQLIAELKWTEQAVKEVTGVSPRFIRPPFGNIDNRVRDICKALGFVRMYHISYLFLLKNTNNVNCIVALIANTQPVFII